MNNHNTIALPDHWVITKTVPLDPLLSDAEIESWLIARMTTHFGEEAASLLFDYRRLSPTEVLVVAAKKTDKLDLNGVSVIDLECYAVWRALKKRGVVEKVFAVLSQHQQATKALIFVENICVFSQIAKVEEARQKIALFLNSHPHIKIEKYYAESDHSRLVDEGLALHNEIAPMQDDLQLNLLPWRDQKRRSARKKIYTIWFKCLLLGIGIVVFANVGMWIAMHGESLTQRYLTYKVAKLQQKASAVISAQQQQQTLTTQLNTLKTMASDRWQLAPIFNALTGVMPDGTYLTSVASQGSQLVLLGRAETEDQINNLLLNIKNNKLFTKAIISNQHPDDTELPYHQVFTLQLTLAGSAQHGN